MSTLASAQRIEAWKRTSRYSPLCVSVCELHQLHGAKGCDAHPGGDEHKQSQSLVG
jgi:hypothetical protein